MVLLTVNLAYEVQCAASAYILLLYLAFFFSQISMAALVVGWTSLFLHFTDGLGYKVDIE